MQRIIAYYQQVGDTFTWQDIIRGMVLGFLLIVGSILDLVMHL